MANFDSVVSGISVVDVTNATKKLQALFLDLSVKETNLSILSHLGGNELQAITLLGMKHKLVVSPNTTISTYGNELCWDVNFLLTHTFVEMRVELNKIFPSILESSKMLALYSGEHILKYYEENKDNFSAVESVFSGNMVSFAKYSQYEKVVLAYVLCLKLAKELDDGVVKNIPAVGNALLTVDPELQLIAIHNSITLDRMIKHGLDEKPIFKDIVDNIPNLTNQ